MAPIVALLMALAGLASGTGPAHPFESGDPAAPQGRIDELVFARLELLGMERAGLCSDAVFVRRVYLDVIGTLPTAQETRAFLLERRPDKRALLIDRLLEREEFADYWSMKWADLLRIKAEFPINLWPNAVQAYHRWIHASLQANQPYDQFVRRMLTANGSNFRVPEVNFFRATQGNKPQVIAQAVALSFMGTRADQWPPDRLDGMAAFFSQLAFKSTGEWKEEIVYFDPALPPPAKAVFPDGTVARIAPGQDPREVFADWLIKPENPWFARNIANRIWTWLLGQGIIHEPDDIRPDNPPSHPELLAYLEKELVTAKYDLKHLYRLILNSATYQLSCIPRTPNPQARANFAFYPLRRLEAEVLIDALNQITGTTEKYSSPIPEPFTFVPEDYRAIEIADGSITSSFLEMFGRPPRDTGLDSERTDNPTSAQRLHLLNSSHIQRKIEQGPRLRAVLQSRKGPRQIATQLYLTILNRFPTNEELKMIDAYTQSSGVTARQAAVDLVWALINSAEFQYRH